MIDRKEILISIITDKILEVANGYNELTTSDLQGNAEAESKNGGKLSLTQNVHTKEWIASKGTKTLPKVRWLK
jgi:hypothetical protein